MNVVDHFIVDSGFWASTGWFVKLEYAPQLWSPHYAYLQFAGNKIWRQFFGIFIVRNNGVYSLMDIDYTTLLT